MVNSSELLEAINQIAEEKKINKQVVFEGIKEGFQKAFERFFDTDAQVITEIDENSGVIRMFQELKVVDKVDDDWLEIGLDDVKKEFGDSFGIGDIVKKEIEFDTEFSRLAVFQVRQIIQQKIKAAERVKIYEEFIDKEHEILQGKITGMNEMGNSYLIDIDGTQASLWNQKIIPGEKFEINEYVSFYVESVEKENKFSQIMVSRVAPEFLIKLLEQDVPEIENGLVEVKAVSREPGKRAKVAVWSKHQEIDPVGSVVGTHGSRINQISKELKGEKIDVIKWDEDLEKFIMNAMAPVRVISVNVDRENNECDVIVPNEQLSLAIGKGGIAARLVANLVKMRVNIYSYENARLDQLEILWNGNIDINELTDPAFLEGINKRKNRVPSGSNHSNNDYTKNKFNNHQNQINYNELETLQNEIKIEQELNNQNHYEDIPQEELNGDDKTSTKLTEIEANLQAFSSFEEDNEDSSYDDDSEIEDYDEYYDEK